MKILTFLLIAASLQAQVIAVKRRTVSALTVATPTNSPGTGSYITSQAATVNCATSGCVICTTIDGSTPAASTPGTCSNGATHADGDALTAFTTTTTLKALGTKSGMANSAQMTPAVYTVTAPPGISFVSASQSSAGTPCIITKTLSAGDTLIIGVAVSSATQSNLTTPTSSAADTSTIALVGSKQTQGFDSGSTMAIYILPSATGGSETFTETQGGGLCGMVVFQFSGSVSKAIDGSTIVNDGATSVATSICTPGTGGAACTSTFTPSGSGEVAITFSSNEAFNNITYSAGSVCGGTGTIPANGATSNSFMPIAGQYFLNCPVASTTSSMSLSGSGDRTMALTVLLQP